MWSRSLFPPPAAPPLPSANKSRIPSWILNAEPIRQHRPHIWISPETHKKGTAGLLSTLSCFLLKSFSLGLSCPSLLSASRFEWDVCQGENRISHPLSLFLFAHPGIFIFFNYFLFFSPPPILWGRLTLTLTQCVCSKVQVGHGELCFAQEKTLSHDVTYRIFFKNNKTIRCSKSSHVFL